ncbi:hypothetical protein [Spirosoma koreense]
MNGLPNLPTFVAYYISNSQWKKQLHPDLARVTHALSVASTKPIVPVSNLYYSGKNLYGKKEDNGKKDTTSFTSDVAHVKVGLQVIPIKNILSFYADVNSLKTVVNRDPLIAYNSALASRFTNYWNFETIFFWQTGQQTVESIRRF